MSEYTSCPAIYLFIYFCRGTLIGSHIRALLKDFVAPHRPAAEITCRPLKVKYQQVLSLIKASRMSRVFFFFTLLRWHSDETWQPTRKWVHKGYSKWCLAAHALKLLQSVGGKRRTQRNTACKHYVRDGWKHVCDPCQSQHWVTRGECNDNPSPCSQRVSEGWRFSSYFGWERHVKWGNRGRQNHPFN